MKTMTISNQLPEPLTMRDAEARGYVSVTMAYTKHESALLAKAYEGMAGADAVLVAVGGGTEIWRAKSQVRVEGSAE